MDERPPDPPPWLPAAQRAAQPVPVEQPAARPRFEWRRYVRTVRGAVGLGLLAAFLLLWPLSGFAWLPLAIGLGALVIVRLLRFDGVLRGWDIPLAGLVVVVGLMITSGPWACALAASIGVLIAGLLRLPAWKVAAVGALLCLASGIGFGISRVQTEQQIVAQNEQANQRTIALEGERTPDRVVGAIVEGIVQDDVPGVCGLMDLPAQQQFIDAAHAADCPSAVRGFNQAVVAAPPAYERISPGLARSGDTWTVDGCRTPWATAPLGGPRLGRIEVRATSAQTYYAARFLPC